ncbi:DUF6879 family protein [Mucilaginibacter pedocola]|uniref:DUF6879 domain-containing protein n=1 Tax=Mucilaginibacter pedocola TaxID=1792845 RepID=A0A1S9P8T0_9SPHI|nr:DUF6879 family protein [Mucilaginibacter pedocola]OOQ57376.1 hypothetical protein BC343_14845 [Mucilaginibacter pedocola]
MKYLSPKEFDAKFDELYSNIKSSFLKLETREEYNEYDETEWNSVPPIRIHDIIMKAQEALMKFKDEDKELVERGVVLKRVRVLRYPLNKYCLRQFSSYRISQDNGEKIYIMDNEKKLDEISEGQIRDFVIFDEQAVLLHQYEDNNFVGGTLFETESEVEPFLKTFQGLEQESIPFNQYLKYMNLQIPNLA